MKNLAWILGGGVGFVVGFLVVTAFIGRGDRSIDRQVLQQK